MTPKALSSLSPGDIVIESETKLAYTIISNLGDSNLLAVRHELNNASIT
jgi:hypothetical protein